MPQWLQCHHYASFEVLPVTGSKQRKTPPNKLEPSTAAAQFPEGSGLRCWLCAARVPMLLLALWGGNTPGLCQACKVGRSVKRIKQRKGRVQWLVYYKSYRASWGGECALSSPGWASWIHGYGCLLKRLIFLIKNPHFRSQSSLQSCSDKGKMDSLQHNRPRSQTCTRGARSLKLRLCQPSQALFTPGECPDQPGLPGCPLHCEQEPSNTTAHCLWSYLPHATGSGSLPGLGPCSSAAKLRAELPLPLLLSVSPQKPILPASLKACWFTVKSHEFFPRA